MVKQKIELSVPPETIALIRERAAALDLSSAGYCLAVLRQHLAGAESLSPEHVPDWVRPAQSGRGRRKPRTRPKEVRE